jgi:hypothetical protein
MDERTALAVTAVRAVETADRSHTLWTDDDRAWASRAAAEVVGESASPATFVGRRALLSLERMQERRIGVARMARGWRWRPWVGGAIVVAAFVLGAAADALSGAQRINILYSPVAPLIAWNVAMYLALFVGLVVRYGEAGTPGPVTRLVVWLSGGSRHEGRIRDDIAGRAMGEFVLDWSRRASPLYAARAARVLHVAAAALALGVIAGLYVRGLAFEYRATWESTFLGPETVRAIVAAFYAPGALVTGIPVPDAAQVAAIRSPGSENAARWLHLMAATLAVVVVVPRVLLALGMGLLERHRAAHVLDELDDPYFERLARAFRQGPIAVDAVPYSYAVSAASASALESLLARALGGNVALSLVAPVAYGDEDAPLAALRDGSLRVALFNATATPEREAHGRFLATLARGGRALVIVVDESAQNARWHDDARRRDERRDLWRRFAADEGRVPVFVDLARPELATAEAAFDAALADAP